MKRHKWTARDFARVGEGELPLGEPTDEWSYGDIDAGFAESKVIVEESFVTASTSHHCMEPRTTMSYWDAGKCYVYGSTQSSSFAHPFLAGMVGVTPDKLVFISEYCGGGFGSKLAAYPSMAIPALLSKKVGRPVMMRINREEESYIGSSRAGLQGRIKMGSAPTAASRQSTCISFTTTVRTAATATLPPPPMPFPSSINRWPCAFVVSR